MKRKKKKKVGLGVDFKTRSNIRGKEAYLIMTKWSISQEDVTIRNVYVSNNKVSKYKKSKLAKLKREIGISYLTHLS